MLRYMGARQGRHTEAAPDDPSHYPKLRGNSHEKPLVLVCNIRDFSRRKLTMKAPAVKDVLSPARYVTARMLVTAISRFAHEMPSGHSDYHERILFG